MSYQIEDPNPFDATTMDFEVHRANLGLLMRMVYSNSNRIVQSPFPLPTGEVRVGDLVQSLAAMSSQGFSQIVKVS